VQNGESTQQCLAARCKFYKHFALILTSVAASHSATINEPIYKFYSAVMAKTELMGEHRYGGTSVLSQALDCQEKLMLLRFDTLGASRFLA
jgi:hypothetical protein